MDRENGGNSGGGAAVVGGAVAGVRAPAAVEGDPVLRAMKEEPYVFDFYRAVRYLECANRDRPRVGYSERVGDDPVRFCQLVSLAFAPSTLAAFEAREGRAPRLFVHFMGMLGPNGPMPLHLTEFIRDRERNAGDATLARFMDVFNHRMVCLFYRAWAAGHQAVSFDRPEDDRFAAYVGSLIGLGLPSLWKRDALADVAKLHYSGRLGSQTKNAEGLRAILADYFGVPVEVEEFVGQWLELPKEAACRLGETEETGALGRTCIVGSRVWDCQQRFRIRMGPMGLAAYERLLPGGKSLERLVAWVKNYVGEEFAWDVRLVLEAREVPRVRLGKEGKLGWTTWVRSKPVEEDRDDLVLRPYAA